eukprot:10977723-Lingulodinium_polyedra.AAC.1
MLFGGSWVAVWWLRGGLWRLRRFAVTTARKTHARARARRAQAKNGAAHGTWENSIGGRCGNE